MQIVGYGFELAWKRQSSRDCTTAVGNRGAIRRASTAYVLALSPSRDKQPGKSERHPSDRLGLLWGSVRWEVRRQKRHTSPENKPRLDSQLTGDQGNDKDKQW